MRKRIGATVVLALSVLVLMASPALAHVTVDPSEAPKGSFVKLTFRVPNEVEVANTVRFDVKFDEKHPITTIAVKPKVGWTPTVSKHSLQAPLTTADGQVTEAVSEISWTGGTIAPGQFDEFEVSAGPLPSDVELLLFPAVQIYDDGTEVSWIQQSFAGKPEPEHPAPELTLTAAAGTVKAPSAGGGSNTLAGFAFVLGAGGLGIGTWAWWNVRRWR